MRTLPDFKASLSIFHHHDYEVKEGIFEPVCKGVPSIVSVSVLFLIFIIYIISFFHYMRKKKGLLSLCPLKYAIL